VKRKKTRTVPRKKKSARLTNRNQVPALKERLDAEFATAVVSAKAYVGNPSRLHALFLDAAKEASSMPRGPFGDSWPYFQAMLRLIRAYADGRYREVPENTLVVIVAAIVYLVNPLDVIPDALPALGYLDDATVLALALRRSRDALDDFMTWETTTF
jgi:uncharacterized membrane protein YkvA (DUF1232 family)